MYIKIANFKVSQELKAILLAEEARDPDFTEYMLRNANEGGYNPNHEGDVRSMAKIWGIPELAD